MNIIKFVFPLIFVIMGIILRAGKGSFLIAGYNTSSKEEKEKYDELALCKFVGNLIIFMATIMLMTAVAEKFNFASFNYINIISPLLIFFVAIGAAIYANTGDRFKKK